MECKIIVENLYDFVIMYLYIEGLAMLRVEIYGDIQF